MVTKTELARLVRVARGAGHIYGSATEVKFFCPINMEAKHRCGDRTIAHTFSVHHLPWEKGTDVASVTKALRSHLEDAEVNGELCEKDIR